MHNAKYRYIISWVGMLLIAFALPAISQTTPDQTKAGDDLLRKMSDKLASAKAFSVNTSETHDRVKLSGEKTKMILTRNVLVRRPNGMHALFHGKKEWNFWYDGKFLTGVSDADKAYIQAPMPATIDDTMDEIAERFDLNMPMSDLFYSSPYDSLMSPTTKGGLVGEEKIGETLCHHLSYQEPDAADWQIWISEKDSLPYKLLIVYKGKDGQPVSEMYFKDWNLSPTVSDKDFAFQIPKGYERIPIMERVRLEKAAQTGKAKTP